MRWLLAALVLIGCTIQPAPLSPLESHPDPIFRAVEIWNAGFAPIPGTVWIETTPQMFASGMAFCTARIVAIQEGLPPEITTYVTLHELAHLRLGCKESDHDPEDFLMRPAYDHGRTLHRMREILHSCQTAACVNSKVFSPNLRARILSVE